LARPKSAEGSSRRRWRRESPGLLPGPAGTRASPDRNHHHGGGFVGGPVKKNSRKLTATIFSRRRYAVFSINTARAEGPVSGHGGRRAAGDPLPYGPQREKKWKPTPKRIALVGGIGGGYLSHMVGYLKRAGIKARQGNGRSRRAPRCKPGDAFRPERVTPDRSPPRD